MRKAPQPLAGRELEREVRRLRLRFHLVVFALVVAFCGWITGMSLTFPLWADADGMGRFGGLISSCSLILLTIVFPYRIHRLEAILELLRGGQTSSLSHLYYHFELIRALLPVKTLPRDDEMAWAVLGRALKETRYPLLRTQILMLAVNSGYEALLPVISERYNGFRLNSSNLKHHEATALTKAWLMLPHTKEGTSPSVNTIEGGRD